MFLDPEKLQDATAAQVLEEAAQDRLGIDQRFLKALSERPAEALPAVLAFTKRERAHDRYDLIFELVALLRHWKSPEIVPFVMGLIKQDPEDLPDEIAHALVEQAPRALEPLLQLYGELEESESGDVAFLLASLGIRDERILKVLEDRLPYDFSDTLLLLDIYGDPAAVPAIEKEAATLTDADREMKQQVDAALASLRSGIHEPEAVEPFDLFSDYPEKSDLALEALNEDERTELLNHPSENLRALAAGSFFNASLTPEERQKLLAMAQSDVSVGVRARAWESLIDAVEKPEVMEAMLRALRNPALPLEERGGLLVGLSAETDRNEVRQAMTDLYAKPEGRAKAMEAMWRSMHPSFRENFPKHLDDPDVEIRRAALWGIGYYGIKSELEKVRRQFEDEDLRHDAIFAYTLALPGEISRGRVKSMLARVEKDAKGLSELEEALVKAALDERLMMAGKEPVFSPQED